MHSLGMYLTTCAELLSQGQKAGVSFQAEV